MFYDYPVLESQSRTLMEETAEFREERGELEKAQKEETRRTAVRKLLSPPEGGSGGLWAVS